MKQGAKAALQEAWGRHSPRERGAQLVTLHRERPGSELAFWPRNKAQGWSGLSRVHLPQGKDASSLHLQGVQVPGGHAIPPTGTQVRPSGSLPKLSW